MTFSAGEEPQHHAAMSLNHQSASKCVNLVNSSIVLLKQITPATGALPPPAHQLGVMLEELKNELLNVLNRAERKQLRRVIREKLKEKAAKPGGD